MVKKVQIAAKALPLAFEIVISTLMFMAIGYFIGSFIGKIGSVIGMTLGSMFGLAFVIYRLIKKFG
ncbi:MAG TPA: hypothetical protein ENG50_00505 [Candidatus Altiarchaeales archaeon]|nr:MAG: hypothetical protein DRO65_01460 [Candidatus Altiarchaeales archaeon]HDN82826.1 hypothetical protein [Candidatus Altiarchaeales archaeon]